MGASCGIIKKGPNGQPASQSKSTVVLQPRYQITSRRIDPTKARKLVDVDPEQALIGQYFMQDELEKTMSGSIKNKLSSRLQKWHKMAGYDPSSGPPDQVQIEKNLELFLQDKPVVFQRRLCKGPPHAYRWAAWKIQSKSKMARVEGAYDELLKKIHNGEYNHTINKDLDRTFPEHPFFQKNKYGSIGQELLGRSLKVYAQYNEKIGYCQGMNFILAFLLMVNGGSDEEAFWFFVAITKKHQNFEADRIFDGGLEGFFQEGFPLMRQFMFQFEFLFEQKMPKLKKHFEDEGLASALWIQKWFMTLFLYSFPLSLCIRLWDNVLVYGIVFLFQVPLAVLKINHDQLLKLKFEDLNVYLNSFKDKVALNSEDVISVAQKLKIREKTLQELKLLFNESIKDMDNGKPVRRLLVIPELKEESADDGSESDRRAQSNSSLAASNDLPNESSEQGIQRKNSEYSQKQSSQIRDQQSLKSYVYSKGQLIRVSQIDRMLTKEDLNLEESYVESRQNSSQMPRMLSREITQNLGNSSSRQLTMKEEEFKLPPIHQNRPSISTVIFPTFNDQILMVQRPISSHDPTSNVETLQPTVSEQEMGGGQISSQSSFKVIGHVFDYHSMNEAIEQKSSNNKSQKSKKKKTKQQQKMFKNRLGQHHLNNTGVFSEDELDDHLLGDQHGEEIKEEIQEDDSDNDFDYVVEQLDQQTDNYTQKQSLKIDTSKIEDSKFENNYSSQYFRADSDMISDSQLHLSAGLSGRHGDILRALQQQKNTPEINNDSESEDNAKRSLNLNGLSDDDEREGADNDTVSSLGNLSTNPMGRPRVMHSDSNIAELNMKRTVSAPADAPDLNKQYQDMIHTVEYYNYYHSLKPRDPRLPKPTYVPTSAHLIQLEREGNKKLLFSDLVGSENQNDQIMGRRGDSQGSENQEAFQIQTQQISGQNPQSMGSSVNQLSNQLSQMDLEGTSNSPVPKGFQQQQMQPPMHRGSSNSLGGGGDPFMTQLGFGMQNNEWSQQAVSQYDEYWNYPQQQQYDQYDPMMGGPPGGNQGNYGNGGGQFNMNQYNQNQQFQQYPTQGNGVGPGNGQFYQNQNQGFYSGRGGGGAGYRGGGRGGKPYRNSFYGNRNQNYMDQGGQMGASQGGFQQMNFPQMQKSFSTQPYFNNRGPNDMMNQVPYNQMGGGGQFMNPMMQQPGPGMYNDQFDRQNKKNKAMKKNQNQMMNEAPKSEFLEEIRQKIAYEKKIEIADIKGHVIECSKDQYGSRFIQKKFEMASTDEKDMIFNEIVPEAKNLMTDVFGNYVIQKLFEYGFQNHRALLADQMISHVLELTLHMYGCRVVQKAIEEISFQQQKILVSELKDKIMQCVYDQNGNHVIQKCIEKMQEHTIDFILKPIIEKITDLCVHNYGCRVVQRVLEFCKKETIDQIVPDILKNISVMMIDPFGNYVIQHILEHGKHQEYKNFVVKAVLGNVLNYSNHKFASNVVEKCLEYGEWVDIEKIIDEIIQYPNDDKDQYQPLYQMMKDKYGNYVVQKAVEKGNEKQKENLLRKIQSVASIIRRQANYSRHVFTFLEKLQNDGLISGINLDQGPLPGPPGGLGGPKKDKKGPMGGPMMPMQPMQTMQQMQGQYPEQPMGNFMPHMNNQHMGGQMMGGYDGGMGMGGPQMMYGQEQPNQQPMQMKMYR